MQDDDFKISMDDIKDMVSELFGEKIEKIENQKAKQILNEYTDELLLKDALEEEMSKKIKEETIEKKEVIIEEKVKKNIEDEIRKKVEDELREKIKKEIEEERIAKRKEILKKLEQHDNLIKQESVEKNKQALTIDFSEKLALINLFEQSQKILLLILAKLLKREAAEKMFYKTLEKSTEKHAEILKKVNYNQYSKPRMDGSMEVGRVAANLNALNLEEEHKIIKLCDALREIFEERLIAIDIALGIDTKNEIISNLIIQLETLYKMEKNKNKLMDIFFEKIMPDTTLKAGE